MPLLLLDTNKVGGFYAKEAMELFFTEKKKKGKEASQGPKVMAVESLVYLAIKGRTFLGL